MIKDIIETKKSYYVRILFFLLGTLINSFGIVLITKSGLGTSQISSISYVFSLSYPTIGFGTATFILNAIFWLIQLIILRGRWKSSLMLQLPAGLMLGLFINLFMMILTDLNPSNIVMKYLLLIIGCIVLGLGISIEVAPDVVKIPGEGIVFTISKEKNIKFGTVKNIFDAVLVSLAIIYSLIFFGTVVGIGVGTVLSALTVGRFVNFFDRRLEGFYRKNLSGKI